MRMGTATMVLVVMACGDGPNSGVTLTGPQLTTFTNPGPNDDGPNDDTAPAPTDTTATTLADTTHPAPTTSETTTPSSTTTGTSGSGDVSTGPVGEPASVLINFDELGTLQPIVTDQYAQATFSSEGNCAAIAAMGGFQANTSGPNILYLSSKTDNGCINYADLYIDFPSPAYDLTFNGASVWSTGLAGRVRVFQLGVETALIDIIGTGDTTVPVPVDLGAFPGITRIEIVDTELGNYPGYACWDDFSFTVYL